VVARSLSDLHLGSRRLSQGYPRRVPCRGSASAIQCRRVSGEEWNIGRVHRFRGLQVRGVVYNTTHDDSGADVRSRLKKVIYILTILVTHMSFPIVR
jgi:hypothetical protein